MNRYLRSAAHKKAAVLVLLLTAVSLSSQAQQLPDYWTYQTSLTGATRFNTLAEAEAAMLALGEAQSQLRYQGTDNNDALYARRIYAAEVPRLDPDDEVPWTYLACNWDLVIHECGPDGPNVAAFSTADTALGHLHTHGFYSCGIASGPVANSSWWHGYGLIPPPTTVPELPFQESQVRGYDFVSKHQPAPSEPQDCSVLGSGSAIVRRSRDLSCPAGYAKVGPDLNGQFQCENNLTAEITKNNDVYEHSVKQCAGNPCNPTTGTKTETTTDYVAPGIKFSRTFRSRMVPWAMHAVGTRRLPPNWTHSYVRVLRLDVGSSLPNELFRPDGNSIPVAALAGQSDVYVASDGSGTQVRPGAGTDDWDVYFSDGGIEHYDSVTCVSSEGDYTRPRLAFIQDATTNKTSVYYPDNCADHPNQVVGPFGHGISIVATPFDPDVPTFIEKITDSAGGDIVYGYSAGQTGKLLSVTYQDGKSLQYHYEDTQAGNEDLLTGVTDEEGQRYSTFTYDFAGRATSTEHAGGDYRFTFDYDSTSGNGIQNTIVSDANGNQKTYGITTGGPARPWIITDPNGSSQHSYEGSAQFRITQRKDEKAIKTTYMYDDFHQIQLIEGDGAPEQRITDYEYLSDTADLKTKATRPSVCNDGTTRFAEDEIGYVPGTQNVSHITSRGYRLNAGTCEAIEKTTTFSNHNVAGRPRLIDGPRTDVTDTVTIAYNECVVGAACGQAQSVTNALGHTTTFDSYDSDGRLLQSTDANGLMTSYAYDLRGRILSITETPVIGIARITSFTYEARNLVKTATLPDGMVLNYSYNAAHRLQSVTDNLGNHIDYGYDLHGNRTDEDVLDSANVLTRATDYVFDASHRLDTINRGGVTTDDFTYDATGRVNYHSDANSALTQIVYDNFYRVTLTADANWGLTYLSYDVADNLVSVQNPVFDITSYVYDDFGNLLSESSPDRGLLTYNHDDAGNVTTETDARGKLTTYSYDELNRLTLTTFDDGQTLSYNYDLNVNGTGRLSNTVDGSGMTAWLYDNFGAVIQKQQVIGVATLTTAYSYDSAGRMQTMTLPSGKELTYGYNSHLVDSLSVDGQVILSGATYVPFGPVNGWTWGDLTSSSRSFDLRGLMTSQSLAADTRSLDYNPMGQITSLDDNAYDRDMTYDLLGRLDSFASDIVVSGGSEWLVLANVADPDTSYIQTVDTSSVITPVVMPLLTGDYEFRLFEGGGFNRIATSAPITVVAAQSPLAPALHLSATVVEAGTPITVTLNNGTINFYDYLILDPSGATGPSWLAWSATGGLSSLTWTPTVPSSPGDYEIRLYQQAYYNVLESSTTLSVVTPPATLPVLDVSATNVVAGETVNLTAAIGGAPPVPVLPASQSFVYDSNGNRSSLTEAGSLFSYAIDYNSNRLDTVSGPVVKSYSYDAAGNTINDGVHSYAYNARGRLVSVDAGAVSYQHNAQGQRVEKNDGSSTVFAYGESGELLGEYDALGAAIQETVYFNGAPVAVLQGSSLYQVHTDHLGTPRVITDAGEVVWRWESDPFGTTAADEDPDGDGISFTYNLRFPGQYYDQETGLHYNYFRTYNPSTGRYLESDPIGLGGGPNTYAYVENMPTMYTDRFGLANDNSPYHGLPSTVARDFRQYRSERYDRARQSNGALYDFLRNYRDMRAANTIGADSYFHCKANCQATKRGPKGEEMACEVSDAREWFDQNIKGDPLSASAADQAANLFGRNNVSQAPSCSQVCAQFRPNGLAPKY